MKRILSQCVKELAQFRRDRLTLALAFILPFMTLLIFGFAIRLEAKNIPLFVQDFDISPLSRTYIERLYSTNQFVAIQPSNLLNFLGKNNSESSFSHNPQTVIDRGLAQAVVIIPPNFSQEIKAGKAVNVQVLVDGTDANNARVIRNSIKATTDFFLRSENLLPTPNNQVLARVRLWFNPGRKEDLYIVPGLYGLIFWIYPSLLTAVAMVREKEKGTILQIYASSLTASELLLGKGLAYLIIGISQAIFIMTAGWLIWGLTVVQEPSTLVVSTLLFLIDAISFGLLIGVRTANQNSAIQAVSLIGFLTALLLSGFIYPLNNIPFPLSLISNIVPARYYIEISRDAFVRGTGWIGVWGSMIVLVIAGLILFNVARKNLRKMQLSS